MNLSPELLLDLVQVEPVLVGDEVDGKSQVSETARTTDTMKVGFRVLGEIKVDDDVDGLDIDTTGEKVRADKVAADALSEIVEHAVTVRLQHLCVRVETRIAQLSNFLGQQLDPVGGVAENDGLINVELSTEVNNGCVYVLN